MVRTLWRSHHLYMTVSLHRFSLGFWAYSYGSRTLTLEVTLGPFAVGYDALGVDAS